MARKKKADIATVYELKVTLNDTTPAIWRRIRVSGDTKLPDLHLMLQAAMGWMNCHLHLFTINGVSYSIVDPDFDMDMEDEANVRLDQLVTRPKAKFLYSYDFGDGWEHKIVVEKILPPEPDERYPFCKAGARACPPEDCGGVWGYGDFLEAIRDPTHEEHESFLEWVGGSFDPEAFDLEQINENLKSYKLYDMESCE